MPSSFAPLPFTYLDFIGHIVIKGCIDALHRLFLSSCVQLHSVFIIDRKIPSSACCSGSVGITGGNCLGSSTTTSVMMLRREIICGKV